MTLLELETIDEARAYVLAQTEIAREAVGVLFRNFDGDTRLDELVDLINARADAGELTLVGDPSP